MAKRAYLNFDTEELVDDLKHGVIDILFITKDDKTRLLKGTLQPSYFKKPFFNEDEKQARANFLTNANEKEVPVLHVWDVEQNDWYSFRLDRVLSLQLTNG